MEKAKLRLLATLCLLFAGAVLYAQQGTIVLRNASFEDALPSSNICWINWSKKAASRYGVMAIASRSMPNS